MTDDTKTTQTSAWQSDGWEVLPYNLPAAVAEPPLGEVVTWSPSSEDIDDVAEAMRIEAEYRHRGIVGLRLYRDYEEQRRARLLTPAR